MSKKETLIEALLALNETDPNTMVYVGAINGSGWIVIEPCHVLLEKMDVIDDLMKDKIVKYKSVTEKNKATIERNIERNKHDIAVVGTDPAGLDVLKNLMAARSHLKVMRSGYIKRLDTMNQFLRENYKLSSRYVEEAYDHKDDIKGIAFLIEGNEPGDMWFKGEPSKFEFTRLEDYNEN